MLNSDGVYFIYLRKSREDRDAELRGEEETLARHQQTLLDLAQRLKIPITRTYREVVSGETIAARPEMLQMLCDMEVLRPDGVLVVEIERLARGDTRDQGLIMETFKYCETKIITPLKIYDPNDEFDEEYFEFGLFMSRREYKAINRRLQAGRDASIREGKWIGNKAPYGYERIKLKGSKGYTLQIVPSAANIVTLIFQMFTSGTPETGYVPAGVSRIGHLLDDMMIKPVSASHWEPSVIRTMLQNYAYIGKIQSGRRKQKKIMNNGSLQISRPLNRKFLITDGLHPPIIETDVFFEALQLLAVPQKQPHFQKIKSPLSGLIYCNVCGRVMKRKPPGARTKAATLTCRTCGCPTVGAYYNLVEDRLLEFLSRWMEGYLPLLQVSRSSELQAALQRSQAALAEHKAEGSSLEQRFGRICDFFERGIYSDQVFELRSEELYRLQEENNRLIKNQQKDLDYLKRYLMCSDTSSTPQTILEAYNSSDDASYKNAILKQIIHRIDYSKTQRGTRFGDGNDSFRLDIYMKI